MTAASPTAALSGGAALLERAVGYALGSLQLVTQESLRNPTPCRTWDLHTLLVHLNDSVGAVHEAGTDGHIGLEPQAALADPVAALRRRAGQLVGAWAGTGVPTHVRVADRELSAGVVAAAGALEIAVHGWDVGQASGRHGQPVPAALAADLLELAHLLVTPADRRARFAPPVRIPPSAGNSDRLVAFLGRNPR